MSTQWPSQSGSPAGPSLGSVRRHLLLPSPAFPGDARRGCSRERLPQGRNGMNGEGMGRAVAGAAAGVALPTPERGAAGLRGKPAAKVRKVLSRGARFLSLPWGRRRRESTGDRCWRLLAPSFSHAFLSYLLDSSSGSFLWRGGSWISAFHPERPTKLWRGWGGARVRSQLRSLSDRICDPGSRAGTLETFTALSGLEPQHPWPLRLFASTRRWLDWITITVLSGQRFSDSRVVLTKRKAT